MSDTPFECVRVAEVHNHPKADRLEIVKILGTQVCVQKGSFRPDDEAIYFPPDMLIPEDIAEELGVKNYLKHSVYPGDLMKSPCRIGAIRLRQIPSVGFLMPFDEGMRERCQGVEWEEGLDLTSFFRGEKYQPPMRGKLSGDMRSDTSYFPRYTSIQHYYKYGQRLSPGLPVRITEKIHGTNSRVGLVDGEYMAGTHRTNRKEFNLRGQRSLYWQPMTTPMQEMLLAIHNERIEDAAFDSVVVYGEIFGNKVQQMDYGVNGAMGYRVFDMSVGGEYLDWEDVKRYCDYHGIPTVPLLYEGPFSHELVDELMNGPTTVCGEGEIKCSFKGREGIVITPLEEQYAEELQGRLILKAVSPDYYAAMK